MCIEICQSERFSPVLLVEVHKHRLFELGHAVVDGDGVVGAVETMKEGLDVRFLDMADVGGGLARFLTSDECSVGNEPECINDDLALDGLDGIYDDSDSTGI